MITWPIACIVLGTIAALCFLAWIHFRREMEREHHTFQDRAFSLEEKKFEVWKTSNLAHVATHGKEAKSIVDRLLRGPGGAMSVLPGGDMEPQPARVLSMVGRGPHAKRDDEEPPENVKEVLELIAQAQQMPPEEAKAFLAEHGIEGVEFFRGPQPSGPGGA